MTGIGSNQKRTRRTVREFTRAEKVKAVSAALTAMPDKPTGQRGLKAATDAGVRVDKSTLWAWIQEYRDEVTALLPPRKTTAEIVQETHKEITEQFTRTRQAYLEQMLNPDTVSKASARDSAVVVGIMSDHLNKIQGALPYDIQRKIDIFFAHCEALGLEPGQALDDINASLAARRPTLASVLREQPTIEIEAKSSARDES